MSKDKKSSRPRYIRVAAIDIMITQGTWKICVVVSQKNSNLPPLITNTYVLGQAMLVFGAKSSSINISRR
jgi:hypothetical protein